MRSASIPAGVFAVDTTRGTRLQQRPILCRGAACCALFEQGLADLWEPFRQGGHPESARPKTIVTGKRTCFSLHFYIAARISTKP